MSFFHKVILPIKPNIQDTNYDCGAASLKIILNTLGIQVDEEKLMELTETTKDSL